MTRTILSSTLLALLTGPLAFAQNNVVPCAADDIRHMHELAPEDLEQMAADEADLDAFSVLWAAENSGAERVNYTIPVVFHIIHNNGQENITDEQVEDAIRVLNEDYNRLNPDWDNVRPEFLDLVAEVGITFVLARKDPDGNCTKGITRTVSALTNDGTQTMKDLIQWPRNRYLNIWVAASADGAAGYTFRPGSVNNNAAADGIVVLHDYVGAIGTSSPSHSRTLSHEVGHWLNLKHTWGGTNDPGVATNCNDDDDVTDTPNTVGWTICDLDGASCGSPIDNVENYMEYSYCSKMFTVGQKTRMLAALNAGTAQRNQLTTASNLAFTGVDTAPVLCAAEFSSNTSLICAGTSVTFSDMSYQAVTGREWSFPGGEPLTSTEENPTVVYAAAGTYPVTLTVTDGTSTLTTTQNNVVTVMPNPGATPPVQESFESVASLNGPEWYALNPTGGGTFGITSSAAFTGTKSVRILNSSTMAGSTDELLSQTFDMSGTPQDITITFRHAYAKRTSSSDDILSLYISNDCGNVWMLRKIMRGSTNLPTGPVSVGNFVPNASQWAYTEVTNISETSGVSDFRFKFTFDSDGGNNLYLDDININGMPVGVEEVMGTNDAPLALVPNPARDQVQLRYALAVAGHVRMELLDALGRQVMSEDLGQLAAGPRTHTVSLQGLARGSYAVRLSSPAGGMVSRLVVE